MYEINRQTRLNHRQTDINHILDRQEKELTDTQSSGTDITHKPQIRQIGEVINRQILYIHRETHINHRLDRQEKKLTDTYSSPIDKHI